MKITAPKSKNIRQFLFAAALCAAASVSSCGRKQTSALSEGAENSPVSTGAKPAELPLEQQTEQKLDPLTKDDVDLYLKIMRASADRVKNRPPADLAALEGAKKALDAGDAGHAPTPDGVKALEHVNLLAISMDQIVAEEMKVDGRTYRGIAEAVEAVVPNPALTKTPGDNAKPASDHIPTPLEKRLSEVNAANEKFLTPYHDEIQKLIATVRNPANLPK